MSATDEIRIALSSADLAAERLDALRDLFPEAFSEGKLDVERLQQALGDAVSSGPERYGLSWAGKADAMRAVQVPSVGTLVPAPEESVDFDTTENLFIEGDNLEVLKLLQKSYHGKVKMIYIDPPYNTGNELIYPDNFHEGLQDYLRYSRQVTVDGQRTSSTTETEGRMHSKWLSMMYPRIFLGRNLLRDDGIMFVSIDDNEASNLRALMDEVFGGENFLASFVWKKTDSPSRNDPDRYVSNYHDYVFAYARHKPTVSLRKMLKPEILDAYPITLPDGRLARRRQLRKNGKGARREDRPTMWYALTAPDGTTVYPIAPEGWEGRWVLSEETWTERTRMGLTEWVSRDYGWVPYYVEIAPDEPGIPWPTLWDDLDQNRQAKAKFTELMNGSHFTFENPKPVNLLLRMLRMSTSENDLCLDFFAGSCTTAHATYEINRTDGGNRRFIMVQLPEPVGQGDAYHTIADIGKERIRRVIAKLKQEQEQTLPPPGYARIARRSRLQGVQAHVEQLQDLGWRHRAA